MERGNIEGVELFDIASHFLSKRNSEQENPKKVLKITKKTRIFTIHKIHTKK